jgi:hypothetical protein
MGKTRGTLLIVLAALLTGLLTPGIGQAKDLDQIEVKVVEAPPGGLIEVVEGQYFSLPSLPFASDTSRIRLTIPSIPGGVHVGDGYAGLSDEPVFHTRHLRSHGVKADVTYTLVATELKLNGSQQVVATYEFLMHSLPAVSRVHISALILRGRPHLVGLKLYNIGKDDRVKAWGFGFGAPRGPFEFGLRLTGSTRSTRTYAIPGGLRWARKSNPKIKLNVAPPPGAEKYGVPVLGRLLAGVFRTNHRGNTVFRKTDHWKRCTTSLANEKFANRPPFPESCVLLGWNRWNQP